jgi:hypothetical protein
MMVPLAPMLVVAQINLDAHDSEVQGSRLCLRPMFLLRLHLSERYPN